jgi:hypothetical protein
MPQSRGLPYVGLGVCGGVGLEFLRQYTGLLAVAELSAYPCGVYREPDHWMIAAKPWLPREQAPLERLGISYSGRTKPTHRFQ